MTARLAYTLPEAAREASVSEKTLRRAIAATDATTFPPPLRAKKVGRSYRILAAELTQWLNSLEDA